METLFAHDMLNVQKEFLCNHHANELTKFIKFLKKSQIFF
jgi:hypothetical protein